MKVIFKGSSSILMKHLTIGKVYTVIDTNVTKQLYWIRCDDNHTHMVRSDLFTNLDEQRDNIINQLIDERSI